MSENKKFTKTQHEKTGATLKAVRRQLMRLLIDEIQRSYPASSKVYKLVEKADSAIGALANELDNCLSRETTEAQWQAEQLWQIYYGPARASSVLLPASCAEGQSGESMADQKIANRIMLRLRNKGGKILRSEALKASKVDKVEYERIVSTLLLRDEIRIEPCGKAEYLCLVA